MRQVGDYKLQCKLHENYRASVYKAIRGRDNLAVIVKVVSLLNKKALKHIDNEYKVLQNTHLQNVIAIVDFVKDDDYQLIAYEDINGQSLDRILSSSPLDLERFFLLANRIVAAIDEIHRHDIIHCDIKPSNIIVSSENRVKLTDFGIASKCATKTTVGNIQGSLPYLAPERSGWIDYICDYRSDYYSLGATFYEMLTASLPFTEKDTDKLIHAHIAQTPPSPDLLNQEIPVSLSKVVLKLLEKNPQDRYINTKSLMYDLQVAQNSYSSINSTIVTPQLSFEFSTKFYGRDKEVQILCDHFMQFLKHDKPFLNIISGPMGSGKTTVVHSCYQTFFQYDIFFSQTKCENADKPYAAVVQLARGLVFYILTQQANVIKKWREKLSCFPQKDLQEIMKFVPDLANLVSCPSTTSSFEGSLAVIWRSFFSLFVTEKPLLCFIDDIQWIDESSWIWMLAILEYEINVFFVCTSRNSISQITNTTQNLQNVAVSELCLQPLDDQNIERWIEDCTREKIKDIGSLVKVVRQKTRGNVLCIREFLQMLDERKLLYYDREWCYDLEKIIQSGDYTISYTMVRMDNFSQETIDVLQWMCCMGNEFDRNMLCELVTQQTTTQITQVLSKLQRESIIVPCENERDTYRFTHDSIRETLYENMDTTKRESCHYAIGMCLHKSLKMPFDIVQHLNMAITTVKKQHNETICIDCNIKAGEMATKSNAYPLAIKFLTIAHNLVVESAHNDKKWLFAIYILLGECEFLRGNISVAEKYFSQLENMHLDVEQQFAVCKLRLILYSNFGEYKTAAKFGLRALHLAEHPIPYDISLFKIITQVFKNVYYYWHRSTDMPQEIHDKMIVLKDLMVVVFMCENPKLFLFMLLQQIQVVRQYGENAFTAQVYIFKAQLSIFFKKYGTAQKLAHKALILCQKYGDPSVSCRVKFFYIASINHWNNHLDSGIAYIKKQVEEAQYAKDHTMFSYGNTQLAIHYLYSGKSLEKTSAVFKQIFMISSKNERLDMCHKLMLVLYEFKNIMDGSSIHKNWQSHEFDEKHFPDLEEASCTIVYIHKVELLYIFHHYNIAYEYTQKVLTILPYSLLVASGTQMSWYFVFYYTLVICAMYKTQSKKQQRQYRRLVHKNKKICKSWAKNCAQNFQHIYMLICAEEARILQKTFRAMQFYDKAIYYAKENGFVHHQGIANEKAGEFYLDMGKEKIAEAYLRSAYECYRKWGGNAKVRALESQYSQLFYFAREKFADTLSSLTATIAREKIDLQTILKTGVVLSSELDLDILVEKWLNIAVESTGATKGILLREENNALQIMGEYGRKTSPQTKFAYSVLNYVQQTRQKFVVGDASKEEKLSHDDYILENNVKSIMCLPLVNQKKQVAILYLENNLVRNVFHHNAVIEFLTVQAAIAIENAILYRRLSEQMSERQKLQQRILQISDDEKQRLGQDIHDGLGQYATAIQLSLHALHHQLEKAESPFTINMLELMDMAKEMTQRISHMARGLVSLNVKNKNLEEVLESLVASSEKFLLVKCHLHYDSNAVIDDPVVVKHLYMIAQEAIHNAKKHAQATNIWISVTTENSEGALQICNDGLSFTDETSKGLGLFTMNNRAQIIGGNLLIKKGEKTSIVCNFFHSSRDVSIQPDF
ncbi:protein kinase domain-containing protein [Candidatus Uabimicrobium amorphum]|uniref:Serine/threonine protein kinase n=1 Tax=Uabimicrobium amorphum TaxID=2596890 RepID=A0A5S9IL81_UABAM|nr:protein kinase [Candidatus Uabimicrobium amorphum]BBM83411.1 serine/threonine protein kinase [Candidatus Uabimicrobium amorphum]